MRHKHSIMAILLAALSLGTATAQRERILFNFDWEFSYDKKTWTEVNLPHDYLVGQPWVAPSADEKGDAQNEAANIVSVLSSRAFKELRKGYYRKTFTPSEDWKGRRVVIDVEGIMLVGDVFLNGEQIGKTDYGYLGLEADISDKLLWDKENVIEVSADPRGPNNSRWYTGGGLYRDVNIIVTDKELFFTRHPLKIVSTIAKGTPDNVEKAQIDIQVECSNKAKAHPKSLTFGVRILDGTGNELASMKSEKKYYPRQRTNEYRLDSIVLDRPLLWDCDNPNLYTAVVSLYDQNGKVVDEVEEEFGIRTIEYGPDFGFKLNGKKTIFKGIANHHTLGALGAAAHEKAIEKRIIMLKEFGINHIRCSHNPYSESFLRLCDKHGILVVDELYDKWVRQNCGDRKDFSEQWQHDVPEWVKRDRNHPCVVMWSLGNELQQMWEMDFADWGVTPYRLMKTLLNRYDETRPVTVAMHPRFRNVDTDSIPAPLALETDIASYNYRYMYFPGDRKRFPNLTFYQSEANTQNIGKNWFEMDLDKVVGLAYWGAIDYLGESMGWPRKGWVLGEFDISLLPKPLAYFLKSYFTDEPMVHLSVFGGSDSREWNGVTSGSLTLIESWNENILNKDSKTVTLHAFSNADEVELLVNGKSRGRLSNNRKDAGSRNKFIFKDITYEKGSAEAVAYNAGKIVARYKLETTGQPVALKIETDNEAWRADGMDLNHVRVFAVDSKGRRVRGTHGRLSFSVEGDAQIAAMSNGDNTCDDVNVPQTVKDGEYALYDGAAMVILRSERTDAVQTKKPNVRLNVTLDIDGKTFKKTSSFFCKP